MNFPKVLLLAAALSGAAGGIVYFDPIGRYRRERFLENADKGAAEIEEKNKNSIPLKALRSSMKDREWELMYWDKVWWDGWDRRTQDEYKGYDKDVWEEKFWDRYITGKVSIKNISKEEIEGIYGSKRYPKGWHKYREMCQRWYVVGEGYIMDANSGHVCLYEENSYPKSAWAEVEKQPEGDVGEILWKNKKELNSIGS